LTEAPPQPGGRDRLGSPDRFGYEWTHFSEVIPEYEEQFAAWVQPLEAKDLAGRYLVDAGCGNGRNTAWMSKWGARRILAFDVEEATVAVARRNLDGLDGVSVAVQSIYDARLPDEEQPDIVFCIGVVHHLADPVGAVRSLASLVKPGGRVLIWVYGREGNEKLLSFLEPTRKITARVPMTVVSVISWVLTVPLYLYLKTPVHKSQYLRLASTFRFWHLRSIVLDQLLPRIANYWTEDEARKVSADAGLLDIITTSVNGMSWSVLGTKP
jgi:SAM-dependent methyltransferase